MPLLQDALVLIGPGSYRFKTHLDALFDKSASVVEIQHFQDGETCVRVPSNVRNRDVYLVHSLEPPVNQSLIELCLTLDALKKGSASRISLIMPYMGYARADRRSEGREAIGAQLVARFLEASGADRIIVIDLHSEQVQGFFRLPVDNIYGSSILMPEVLAYLRQREVESRQLVVVSPDAGGAKRARAVAKALTARFALIDKTRPRANEVAQMVLLGEVKQSNCLIIDDMVDTADTIVNASILLEEKGAEKVFAACTHPLLAAGAQLKIASSCIEKFFVTDSVKISELATDKIRIVALGTFLEELIKRERSGQSLMDFRGHYMYP